MLRGQVPQVHHTHPVGKAELPGRQDASSSLHNLVQQPFALYVGI